MPKYVIQKLDLHLRACVFLISADSKNFIYSLNNQQIPITEKKHVMKIIISVTNLAPSFC